MREQYLTCSDCRPSMWKICPQCGRHYCKHKGLTVCDHCFEYPVMPTPQEGGTRMCRVWRTGAGSYSSQPNQGYYCRKDAQEWADAAQRAGYVHALVERPQTAKWRDYYGRPCSQTWSYWELWIELPQNAVPPYRTVAGMVLAAYDAIQAQQRDAQLKRLDEIVNKPKAEWAYRDHEDYHRICGTL